VARGERPIFSSVAQITPNQFSFSDGPGTFNNLADYIVIFKVATDGAGDITSWVIELDDRVSTGLETASLPGQGTDFGWVTYGSGWGASTYYGSNSDASGAWAGTPPTDPTPSAVPEPSSLLMIGTGICGLAGAFRKRFIAV
jgi:hypothetical protein